MEYQAFLDLVNQFGAENILEIYFDNERHEFFKKPEDFNLNDVKNINGSAVYCKEHMILSKGPKGGFLDIPVFVASDQIQGAIFLKNPGDRDRIDWTNFTTT